MTIGPGAFDAPGNSAGTLTVDGDLDMNGTLIAEFTSPSTHDMLFVTDTVTFTATASIVLNFDFIPEEGDDFDILEAEEILGFWGNEIVNLPASEEEENPGEGLDFFFEILEDDFDSTDVLRIVVVPEPASMLVIATGGLLLARRRGR